MLNDIAPENMRKKIFIEEPKMKLSIIAVAFLLTLTRPLLAHDHAWWPVDVSCSEALDMAHEKCANWDDRDQDHSYDTACMRSEMKKYDFNSSDFGLSNPGREARPFYNEYFCFSEY